jgi:hypothetical protein
MKQSMSSVCQRCRPVMLSSHKQAKASDCTFYARLPRWAHRGLRREIPQLVRGSRGQWQVQGGDVRVDSIVEMKRIPRPCTRTRDILLAHSSAVLRRLRRCAKCVLPALEDSKRGTRSRSEPCSCLRVASTGGTGRGVLAGDDARRCRRLSPPVVLCPCDLPAAYAPPAGGRRRLARSRCKVPEDCASPRAGPLPRARGDAQMTVQRTARAASASALHRAWAPPRHTVRHATIPLRVPRAATRRRPRSREPRRRPTLLAPPRGQTPRAHRCRPVPLPLAPPHATPAPPCAMPEARTTNRYLGPGRVQSVTACRGAAEASARRGIRALAAAFRSASSDAAAEIGQGRV